MTVKEMNEKMLIDRYGVCTSCMTRQNFKTRELKDIECGCCLPGWIKLFNSEMDRDIFHLELLYNIKLEVRI